MIKAAPGGGAWTRSAQSFDPDQHLVADLGRRRDKGVLLASSIARIADVSRMSIGSIMTPVTGYLALL
jgi:hypothetical protein